MTISGNRALGDTEIEDKIATTADSWIPFTERHYLDEAVLQSDLRRIVRLYQAHGYFGAKVTDVKIAPIEDGHAVSVAIGVDEGAPSLVARIDLEGIAGLPADAKAAVHRAILLKVGKPFDEAAYEQAKSNVERRLREGGYAEAKVGGKVVVDPRARAVSVTFELEPGERYQFGRVFVAGTSKVPRQKVVQEAAAAAPPGALYSDSAIADAQNRIFDMGVFSLVKVTRGATDPAAHTVPVVVDVREAPFHTLRASLGLGFEPQRQELRGRAEWINRNFFGGLRKLDFDNKLAYVVTPSVLNLFSTAPVTQGPAGYSQLTFTQPGFIFRDLDFSSSVKYQHDIQVGYRYDSGQLSLGVVRRFGRALEIAPSYNFQALLLRSQLSQAEILQSRAPELATGCTNPGRCPQILSYLEERITLDERDSTLEPHSGYMGILDLQQGGGPGAGFTYLRVEPELRGYVPVSRMLTAALRVHWGWMEPFRSPTTPITQRFFGGGATSVRAYGSRLMSPVVAGCAPGVSPCDPQALPVGGDGLLESTAELRLDLGHDLGLVGFVDAGEVAIRPLEYTRADLAIAPGLGLRYFTLFGPVRLDLAYRLPNPPSSDGQVRLAPSVVAINTPLAKGQPLPDAFRSFNFQFSIGEAF